jgi:beta-glucosidase
MASTKEERVDFLPAGHGKSSLAAAAAAAGKGSWVTRKFPFLATRKGKVIAVIVVLVIIGGGLAGLAALPKKGENGGDGGGQAGAVAGAITSDAHFYGESPPVYPSRKCCIWALRRRFGGDADGW